jgi:ABC-type bacteriocin/lantibiotic exporter with double-glycine peptidase domain
MISWHLTLILIGFGFIKIFVDRWILRPVSTMAEERNATANAIFSNVLQFLEGFLFFRLVANQNKIKKNFEENLEQYKDITVSANNIQVRMDAFSNLIEMVVMLSVLGVGALLFINQIIPLGAYVSLISLYDFFVNPYKFVSNFIHMKKKFSVGCMKVFELLSIREHPKRNSEQLKLTDESFCLKLNDVRFAYEEGHSVFDNLSADFLSGQVAYITGISGAGKSTLLKLIQGLLPLQSGQIYAETNTGKRFSAIDASLVTYVSQTPFLFPGSIAENIALCEDSDIDFSKIEYALEKTCSREFVNKLPGESKYIIQDNARNLSGGEKSRIALARAFYKATPIILLDEIYASVDNATILGIEQAIHELCNLNCCVLFVTHRREWIPKDSDIYCLENKSITNFRKI